MAQTRVLHLITNLWVGGAEMTLYRLLAHTDRERFPSVVVSMIDTGPIGRKIQELGVPVYSLRMRRTLPGPGELLALLRILSRERPQILQTWMYHADLLGLLAGSLCRVPRIAWNLRCSDLPAMTGSSRRTLALVRLCAKLSSLPDLVIANAEAGRRFHEGVGYRPRRFPVIPNGIDLDRFHPDEAARRMLRAELGLPPETLLIGHVGRYDPAKDQATFLRAAAHLRETHPEVHFVLAGRDVEPGNEELSQKIADCGLQIADCGLEDGGRPLVEELPSSPNPQSAIRPGGDSGNGLSLADRAARTAARLLPRWGDHPLPYSEDPVSPGLPGALLTPLPSSRSAH